MPKIFISWGLRSARSGAAIVSKLESAGHNLRSFAAEFSSASNPHSKIAQALADADICFLVCEPSEFIDNPWLPYELGLANAMGKKVYIYSPVSKCDWPIEISPAVAEFIGAGEQRTQQTRRAQGHRVPMPAVA
jgi:hypothetical protein